MERRETVEQLVGEESEGPRIGGTGICEAESFRSGGAEDV